MNGERSTNWRVMSFSFGEIFETTRSCGLPISSRSSASVVMPEIVVTV